MCHSGHRVECPTEGCENEITCVYEFLCAECHAACLLDDDEDDTSPVKVVEFVPAPPDNSDW